MMATSQRSLFGGPSESDYDLVSSSGLSSQRYSPYTKKHPSLREMINKHNLSTEPISRVTPEVVAMAVEVNSNRLFGTPTSSSFLFDNSPQSATSNAASSSFAEDMKKSMAYLNSQINPSSKSIQKPNFPRFHPDTFPASELPFLNPPTPPTISVTPPPTKAILPPKPVSEKAEESDFTSLNAGDITNAMTPKPKTSKPAGSGTTKSSSSSGTKTKKKTATFDSLTAPVSKNV